MHMFYLHRAAVEFQLTCSKNDHFDNFSSEEEPCRGVKNEHEDILLHINNQTE
jgi:hypothetical protein